MLSGWLARHLCSLQREDTFDVRKARGGFATITELGMIHRSSQHLPCFHVRHLACVFFFCLASLKEQFLERRRKSPKWHLRWPTLRNLTSKGYDAHLAGFAVPTKSSAVSSEALNWAVSPWCSCPCVATACCSGVSWEKTQREALCYRTFLVSISAAPPQPQRDHLI